MKKLWLWFLLSGLAFGQGIAVPPNVALKTVNGITSPIANATITVCAGGTSGIPCSPALTNTIFSNTALTVPLSNPFTADANGNYTFAVASGNYTVTVSAANFSGYSYQLTAPISSLIVNGGVFTNTQMNEYLSSLVGGCNTHTEMIANPFFRTNITDAISGCVTNPAATGVSTTGVLGIGVNNSGVSTTAQGGLFTGVANQNDTGALGVQGIAWDTTNAGFTNMELIAGDFGLATTNGSGGAVYEILSGVVSAGLFANQPADVWSGDGISKIGNAFEAQAGPVNKWNRAFLSDPGSAIVGIHLDGTCALGASNNCGSQSIEFEGVSAGARAVTASMQADKTGDMQVSTQSGGVFQINTQVRAFSSLPTCTSTVESGTAPINDSTTNTWGATITGGGANHVLAYCDGTNWTVAAK